MINQNTKKILFLAHSLNSGGAERQMIAIAMGLKSKGFFVKFLCINKENFYEQELNNKNIEVDFILLKSNTIFHKICLMLQVRQYIKRNKFQTVISFLSFLNFLNCFSSIRQQYRVITGERSSDVSKFFTIKFKLFMWFERFSDVKVCNSNLSKMQWLKYYPQIGSKIMTIYNYINVQDKDNYQLYQHDSKKIRIIIAASYRKLKNTYNLLEAYNSLSEKEKSKLEIYWYGNNHSTECKLVYDKCMSYVNKNKLNNVHLEKETKNIYNLMSDADFVALFSKYEGLPNAICEGMMLGKPIIMTKVSDYSILVDKNNGFICDSDSIESIKETLIVAINTNKTSLSKMGQASKDKAKKLFDRDNILNKWISIV